ncbi:MAG: PilZ domain-containing protein [Oligoflexales bacterium]
MTKTDEEKPSKRDDVSHMLRDSKKKRKNYVLVAVEPTFNPETLQGVKNFLRSSYPALAVSTPDTTANLSRQLGRNISLLIISDKFDDMDIVMSLVLSLKEKKRNETIPILFLTSDTSRLISYYHSHLMAFHEVDEYIEYGKSSIQSILSRIKTGLDSKNQRRARRYKMNIDTSFFYLNKDMSVECEVLDMSAYGALIKAKGECIFKVEDQVRLNLPISKYLSLEHGEFLKLSGKVRRVFISGNTAAISFEYLSDEQWRSLTTILTIIANRELKQKSILAKAPK